MAVAVGLPKILNQTIDRGQWDDERIRHGKQTGHERGKVLSLSPNFNSVNDTASFSLMMGMTPWLSKVTSVLRALRWRS